ncbi:sensor histidine kinase [Consotaella salsifontis]|uniref:histidine kinase n=1 Tax=Consotaella salsifontis TaxID=1365950 RepID=A0A1T4MG62_9HYPH|nr:HAMP domain-containing sensor histidine kinase [Consotaella salsifontis]SJZ65778.1 two-component system, cell cycle sensor histidine kinase DivJ [Consotaella salsifontis]
MKQRDEHWAGRQSIDARSLIALARMRFSGFVCPAVTAREERETQARAIGALVVGGLLVALAAPLFAVAGGGSLVATVPLFVAGLLLGTAAALAVTGCFDVVVGGLFVVIILGIGAVVSGGEGWHSPLFWLISLPIAEAIALKRRPVLVASLTSAVLVVVGLLFFAKSPALVETGGADRSTMISALVFGLYSLALAARRAAGRQPDTAPSTLDEAETAAIESATDRIVLRFNGAGRLTGSSEALRVRLGSSSTIASEADLLQRIHVTDRVAYLKTLSDMAAGRDEADVGLKMRVAEDKFAPFSMKLIGLDAEDGQRREILGVLSEERPHDRDELEAALDEARHASAAKSHFLAAVSHELRTPLNAIIGFSDILEMEYFGRLQNPQQKEYVGLIRQSGQHLLSVVNSLLDMSKIEAGRYELSPESFTLSEVMTATADMIRPEAEKKGITLDLRPGCGDTAIVADKRACQQMLINLLANAVKFTDKGIVTLESRIESAGIAITVTDTGIGIAEADLARVGKPFTQLSTGVARQYPGTGLGLSLVKGFCNLHHGTMKISSQTGVGTAVTLRLPFDCTAIGETAEASEEKIVPLTDARKKTSSRPHDIEQKRASA